MKVRPETVRDHDAIRHVNEAAFENHPFSQQTEHLIVDALRAADALSVSLVAEVDGEVVGHIAFSPAGINRAASRWFVLGPVAVLPQQQRRGVGKTLIKDGLDAIRRLGAEGCILVGDPVYYLALGFVHIPTLTMEGIPPQNVMCWPMTERPPTGVVTHHDAFLVGH